MHPLITIGVLAMGKLQKCCTIPFSTPPAINRKKMSLEKFTQEPRLQQFIQLYCYLYITDTLYSGEIIGRIIHVTLCDVPRGH